MGFSTLILVMVCLIVFDPVTQCQEICRIVFVLSADLGSMQVDLALDEVKSLQEEGPTSEDVSTILELEQRTYENGQQVCNHILLLYSPE